MHKPHKNIPLLTYFNFFTDFRLYAPVAIIYFANVTGSFALGMSVFSVVMVSSALFEVPTGIFSDKIGRKKTLILGAASAVLYSILYAVGHSYWILIVGAILEGLSRSFYSGNNDALLHDTLTQTGEEHQYEEFLGKTSSMFQVALAVSAVVGSVLATWSFPLIMWLSVIPQFICLLIALKVDEPKKISQESGNTFSHLEEAFFQFKSNKKLRLLTISSTFGFAFGEAAYQFQSAFYSTMWPVWAIGIAKTASSLAAALSFSQSGTALKKISPIKIILIDNVYNRVINTISALFPTIVSPILMSSTSPFFGVSTVAQNGLFQKEFQPHQRATMGSLASFAGSIAFGVVSFLLGLCADRFSPAHALLFLQGIQLINLYLYFQLFKLFSTKKVIN